jgi:hypothetical protein
MSALDEDVAAALDGNEDTSYLSSGRVEFYDNLRGEEEKERWILLKCVRPWKGKGTE